MRWAVIVAGGSGSRFWPLSTPARPKQILPLAGPRSSAEETLDRLDGLIERDRILLVTGPSLAGPLGARLGLPAANVLVETRPRSTGPALVWASHEIRRRDPAATVLSLHADWHVADPGRFRRAAAGALELAEREPALVTVGVVPERPEPGYGYIVPGDPVPGGARVRQFVEKPAAARAAELIAGGALWNSGLFAWRATTLFEQIGRHTPEIAGTLGALDRGDPAGFFEAVADLSIDVGLLERSEAVLVVRGDFPWDDIGTWEALRRVRSADPAGNVLEGDATVVDGSGNVVWSEGVPIVLAGVDDLVVVAANGRILVIDRHRAADLKAVLDRLPARIREL